MKASGIFIVAVFFIAALTVGCSGKGGNEEAGEWLERARMLADSGKYDEALTAIDSLRANCSDDIDARRRALRLYQEINLAVSQLVIERTDSALQIVNGEYERQKAVVKALHGSGNVTAEQLKRMNILRIKRDSLQATFDVECAKVKYIKTKMRGD